MSLLDAVPQDASSMRCGRENRRRNTRILFAHLCVSMNDEGDKRNGVRIEKVFSIVAPKPR